MSDPERHSLTDTLRDTRALLIDIRRLVAVAGHIEPMLEIDTLVGVALVQTEKCLIAQTLGSSDPSRTML